MHGYSIADLHRNIWMHVRYGEGGWQAFLKASKHLFRGVEQTGVRPDMDHLQRIYEEAGNAVSAESASGSVVSLGADPFGLAAAEREQRLRDRGEDRRPGSFLNPHDMTAGS